MKRKMYMHGLLIAALATAICPKLNAQANLNQPLDQDTSVAVGRLDNGLTYYIKPNSKPENKVELRLVVKGGSILENDDQQGLAHFMEHMEFNGLKHYPKNELVDYLQKIGVRFGADINANTGWDRTYFMLPIPTDNPDNIENGFKIVGDWAGGALITTDEVNDERHVILEELRMRNKNASTRMLYKYLTDMFNGSRYAFRLPGGKDSIVQYADPERIREFYHDWYRPDLMAVIVVGDITKDKAMSLIEKYFGSLKNPANERSRIYYDVAPYATKKAMVVTDSENTSYSFSILFPAHKARTDSTIGDFRESILKSLFQQSVSRKLRNMVQASNPPFSEAMLSLSGTIGQVTLHDEATELDVMPLNDLQRSINAAIGKIVSLAKYGFSESDIQTAKRTYLSYVENAYEGRHDKPSAKYTDEFAVSFMKDQPLVGIADQYKYTKELLPGITLGDLNAFTKKKLATPENYFVLLTAPANDKLPLPTQQVLLQIVNKAFEQKPEKEEESSTAASLLSKEPTPGKIVSESRDAQLGTITYTLSNGVKVTVKPTVFQKDEVLFSGVKYGGNNLYGLKDRSNVTFLNAVINSMGYGNFTPAQLNDYLSGKQVRLKLSMSDVTDDVSGSSSVKDLSSMLALTYLELTSPRKDTALLAGWYNKLKARLPFFKTDPQNAFNDSLTKVMYNGNPLAPIVVPTMQDLNDIEVDRILRIYKEQYGNADGFHFFFVGNVNIDSLKPLIEKYIASLPVKGQKPSYKDNGLRMVNGNKMFRFYKGKDNKSTLLDIYHGEIEYTPDIALKAGMLAQVMTIELVNKVREDKQWIYSGGVSASVAKLPYGHYSINAQMPCGPENVDSIFTELDKEVETYKQNGVLDVDLAKVKKAMIEQYHENIKENNTWLLELQQAYFYNMNKSDFLNYEQRVNAVSVEDLKAAANQLLNKNNFKAASFPE